MLQSTIRAYQEVLSSWVFEEPTNFSEKFAQRRFLKKFEKPSSSRTEELHEKALCEYLSFDLTLPTSLNNPVKELYQARHWLHSRLKVDVRNAPVSFPKGSSFQPTFGCNSIQAQLEDNEWTCTEECFGQFANLVFQHKGLKRAFRRRYARWFASSVSGISQRGFDTLLWKKHPDARKIFEWKLKNVISFVPGSRFSTVPKNNEKRRPINIEPFANLVVQRQIGNAIRSFLKREMSVDLDQLANIHRIRIQDVDGIATIDLSNASDSVSCALVQFLLPQGFVTHLFKARSPFLWIGDNWYYPIKVSSMGNGFTFELMTLILTVLARTLDQNATVFGDDIIIAKDSATRLIEILNSIGFVVNRDKSFIDGDFRESCGANYHRIEGYVKSFDFLWPTSIGDCALLLTKAEQLGLVYRSFRLLWLKLLRHTPRALRGGPCGSVVQYRSWENPTFQIRFSSAIDDLVDVSSTKIGFDLIERYQLKRVYQGVEFYWKPDLRSRSVNTLLPKRHWAKYEMYLASSRMVEDVVTGRGKWVHRYVLLDTDGEVLLRRRKPLRGNDPLKVPRN